LRTTIVGIAGHRLLRIKPSRTSAALRHAWLRLMNRRMRKCRRGPGQRSSTDDCAPTFIDAFARCGGLSLGLMRAGWHGLFAIEKDRFAFDTLKANFLMPGSRYSYAWPDWLGQKPWCVEELLKEHQFELSRLRGRLDLLAGGPPCQGFSSAGRRRAVDPRNELVERYLELVDVIQPKIVLMENVLGITCDFKANGKKTGDPVPNFANKLKLRLGEKYYVSFSTLRASGFGVPQSRPRFFLVAILKSEPNALLARLFFERLRKERRDFLAERGISTRVTARIALSDLEIGRNGTVPCLDSEGYEAIAYRGARNSYQRAMRDGFEGAPSDTRLAKHRPEIKQRFKKIIALCKATGRSNVQLSREMRKRFGIKKMATRVLDPSVRCEQGDEAATSAAGASKRRFAGRITGSAKTDDGSQMRTPTSEFVLQTIRKHVDLRGGRECFVVKRCE
jgi:DNA (cytosine-5)-methyltransferase 1